MTNRRTLITGLGLVGLLSAWFTVLRASDQESAAQAPGDQVALLAARIEKLEKRILALETERELTTRQANAVEMPPLSPAVRTQEGNPNLPTKSAEPDFPPVRIRLLKSSESIKR